MTVAVAALAALALTQPAAVAGTTSRMHQMHTNGAKPGGGASGNNNLIDHGGEVLPTSHIYVIWWGPSSAWASDVQSGMNTFFTGLNGSSYVNTGTQYMRGASISVSVTGTAFDPSNPPNPNRVNGNTLAAEAAKEFPTRDANGFYVVFTSNFPKGGNYCAWHSDGSVNGVVDGVAYMPNTTNVNGCNPGNSYGLSGSEGLRSLANVTAHEFMEGITDDQLNAWYDSAGSEIGDKCAWTFNGAVTLSNGSKWQLQQEWSNAVAGCVQTTA